MIIISIYLSDYLILVASNSKATGESLLNVFENVQYDFRAGSIHSNVNCHQKS